MNEDKFKLTLLPPIDKNGVALKLETSIEDSQTLSPTLSGVHLVYAWHDWRGRRDFSIASNEFSVLDLLCNLSCDYSLQGFFCSRLCLCHQQKDRPHSLSS